MTRKSPNLAIISVAALLVAALGLIGCDQSQTAVGEEDHHSHDEEGGETGPHGGRLLDGETLSIEIAIVEDGAAPHFRAFAYQGDDPVDPTDVQLTARLSRLNGKTDTFSFLPEGDALKSDAAVAEPHSFDVTVVAARGGKREEWTYQSYEGRTIISAAAADKAGIKVEAAGPADIRESIGLVGRVQLKPNARSAVKAWFPGRIVTLSINVGDQIARGKPIAQVESSDSLQTYTIPAPISGVVIERALNVGDLAADTPIVVIGDPTSVQVELHVFPRDAERVRVGQAVNITSLSGAAQATSTIEAFLPTLEASTQTLIARAPLDNAESIWRPGTAVKAEVTLSQMRVPLAVRTSALQRFRDGPAVFARVGDAYEARMLELGRQTPEWTEVLSGLELNENYVTENSFLVRADIEKAGAGHDH